MKILLDNWFAVLTGVFLISMVLYGHYRGFIRLAVSLTALAVTLVIVNFALPKVTSYLKENTAFHQMIEQSMKKASGIEAAPEEETELPSQQRIIIEGLKLPKQLKETLIENNNNEVYQLLGVNAFVDYVSSYLSNMVINIIGFGIMFLIVYIVFRIFMKWLDIVARLPILSGLNKIAGAILGGVEGLLYFWLFCLIITIFSETTLSSIILHQIEISPWLSYLYVNNIFSKLIFHIIAGLW